jgi:hypothetical protein
MYGITILFGRHTWDDLHTWFGALMIASVAIHFAIHWNWVTKVTAKMLRSLCRRCIAALTDLTPGSWCRKLDIGNS